MDENGLKYPLWQEPFRRAVAETRPEYLETTIQQARTVILTRLQELTFKNDREERQALMDSLRTLLNLGAKLDRPVSAVTMRPDDHPTGSQQNSPE